jgi:hypothetical protein
MAEDRHLEVSSAPAIAVELDPRPPRDTTPEPDPPPTRPRFSIRRVRFNGLKVALGLAVATAVALGGALYYTQRLSDGERQATEAITAYTAAWNAHDIGAVRAAMYPSGTFAASDNIAYNSMFTAAVGPDLDRVLTALFAADVRLTVEGRVLLADDGSRASVAQRFRYTVYGLRVVEDGISHYTLIPDGKGRLKVYQHLWWRPRVPESPSMLWAI